MTMPGSYRRKHSRSHPRGWFSLFLRLGGWVCLMMGGVLLVLTFFSAIALRVADRLDDEAGYSLAVISGKSVLGSPEAPEAWRVSFTYKTEAGGRTTEKDVSREFHDEAVVGAEYPLRYLRSDPAVIELEPEQGRTAGVVLRRIALALGLVGLAALWRFGSQANAAILARRDGEKRMAVITGFAETGVEINDRDQARLVWREPDGQTGRSLMHSEDGLQRRYKVGDQIVVFRRGKDSFWEGDVGPPWREIED